MFARSVGLFACLTLVFTVGLPHAMASVYSDSVINNTAPVIYWNLDETTGTTAADLVPVPGGNNEGDYVGGITLNNSGPLPSEGFLNMDSANAAPLATADAQAVEYTSLNTTAGVGTTAYSAQVWFNSSVEFTTRTLNYVFGRGNGHSGGNDLRDHVYVGGNYSKAVPNVLHYISGRTDQGAVKVAGSRVLRPDSWYNMLFVRDDSQQKNVKIYLNGKLDIECTAPWFSTGSNPPGNGEYFTAGNRCDYPAVDWLGLRGRVDEVAAWDQALSAAEAKRLFAEAVGQNPYSTAVLADSPEAYWRLNETTTEGDTAVDTTGHGHDFTYHATPTRTGTAPDVGPRPAEFGGFDSDNNSPTLTGGPLGPSTDGYLGIATGVLPGTPGGTNNDYSIDMWFRRADDPNPYGDYLLHRSDSGAPNGTGDFLGVSGYSGDEFTLFAYNGDGSVQNRWGTTTLLKNEWYHVGMIREGNEISVYLNGQLEISTTMPSKSGTAWADGTWAFGGRIDMPTQQKFAGNIDEIAIYRGAVDPSIFKMHFDAALPEPSTWVLLALGGLGLLAYGRRRP